MSGVTMTGEGCPEALNRLAREQMKRRLLADVLLDLTVCELEGWDKVEYIEGLRDMLAQVGR